MTAQLLKASRCSLVVFSFIQCNSCALTNSTDSSHLLLIYGDNQSRHEGDSEFGDSRGSKDLVVNSGDRLTSQFNFLTDLHRKVRFGRTS